MVNDHFVWRQLEHCCAHSIFSAVWAGGREQHRKLPSFQAEQNRGCLQPVDALLVRGSDWLMEPSTLSLADFELSFQSGICFMEGIVNTNF